MKPRTGCTLFELLLLVAIVVVGVVVARSIGASYGLLGYVGGFVAGVAGAVGVFAAFCGAVGGTIGILTGVPEFPVCANGTCRDAAPPNGDYRYEMFGERVGARCKCGTAYMKKGRRFFRLEDDGSLSPYMIWKPLRGWFNDDSAG